MLSDSFYLNEQSYLKKDLPLGNTGGVQEHRFWKVKAFTILSPSLPSLHPPPFGEYK